MNPVDSNLADRPPTEKRPDLGLVAIVAFVTVHGIDHINIDTHDLDATIKFYAEVLGLDHRAKPSGNSGAWLYIGDVAVVHVNVIADDRSNTPTGSFNHVAFAASDVNGLSTALEAAGYEHKMSERPDLGITQIFTTDPNGIAVELNIPTAGS